MFSQQKKNEIFIGKLCVKFIKLVIIYNCFQKSHKEQSHYFNIPFSKETNSSCIEIKLFHNTFSKKKKN